MRIERKRISDLHRAAYNPRIELHEGDSEYDALRQDIEEHGLVVPIVWNEQTGNVVGGHQRLTVCENLGMEEVDVSVIDVDEATEKRINIALNKAQGTWDDAKLAEFMESLGERAQKTGFSLPELEALTSRVDDMVDDDFLEQELSKIEQTFNLLLTFKVEDRPELTEYIKVNDKAGIIELITKTAKEAETDGV